MFESKVFGFKRGAWVYGVLGGMYDKSTPVRRGNILYGRLDTRSER